MNEPLTAHLHAQMTARVLVVRDSSGEEVSRIRKSVHWAVSVDGVDEPELGGALNDIGLHPVAGWTFRDRCWTAPVAPLSAHSRGRQSKVLTPA